MSTIASFAMIWLVIACGLIAILDLRYMIIPDGLNLSLGLAGILFSMSDPQHELSSALLGGLVAGATMGGVRLAYAKLRHVEGLGLGDVKFAVAAGLWTGPWDLPPFLLLAALIGLAAAAFIAPGLKDRMPFGPSLALALALVVLARRELGSPLVDAVLG